MERRDPYRILQVDPSADPDVIKAAYRVLARKLHPDGRTKVELTAAAIAAIDQRMADLNWAYAILRDGAARAALDRERGRPRPEPASTQRSHGAPRTDATADPAGVRLDFGRYEGLTLREVARRDIEYLRWLSRHASGARHRRVIAELLRGRERPPSAR